MAPNETERQWDVQALRALCISKLWTNLGNFRLHEERIRDVVELLRFVYDNKHTKDRHNGKVDELRSLVSCYAACMMENLQGSEAFQELLVCNGELGRDLIEMLMVRG